MAGIEGAVLGAATSVGIATYATLSGFSARHDQSHDVQASETRRLIDEFEKLRKAGDLADEDYELFMQKKEIALQSGQAYRRSISEYKNIKLLNPLNIPKKIKKRPQVRKNKGQVRRANQDMQDHYYASSSTGSDASSIAAQSGSPPETDDIRGWADSIAEPNESTDEEAQEEYFPGGYHPVEVGDTFSDGRYIAARKLRWESSWISWLAMDKKMNRPVSIKIVKSAPQYTKEAIEEIKWLQRLITPSIMPNLSNFNPQPSPAHTHPGHYHIISFLDHFIHRGPNGMHVCMVFEVPSENLLRLIKRYQLNGVPIPLVRQIAKQILLGLDYMHRFCDMIHADLRPENVFICIDDTEFIPTDLAVSSAVRPPSSLLANASAPPGQGGEEHSGLESVVKTDSQPISSTFSREFRTFKTEGDDKKKAKTPSTSIKKDALIRHEFLPSSKTTDLATGVHEGSLDAQQDNFNRIQVRRPSLNSQTKANVIRALPDPSKPAEQHKPPIVRKTSSDPSASIGREPQEDLLVLYEAITEKITVKIGGVENATWADKPFTQDIKTEYRCPQLILGGKCGPSSNLWSIACIIFELISGGDYLFEPRSGATYKKDDDHLAQIIELLGDFPKDIAMSGNFSSEFFNDKGELININKLRYWPLEPVLHEKYLLPGAEAAAITAFLSPMLCLHPDERATASEMVHHDWLGGVVVRGEIEIIKRMEWRRQQVAEDGRRRGREEGRKESSTLWPRVPDDPALDMGEWDALKPVDDSAVSLDRKGKGKEVAV